MFRFLRSTPALFLQLLLVATCSGCGSSGDGYSGPRGTVSGTITVDGKPLQSGCQVLFMATKGGYTAAGVVGDGGKYTLTYAQGNVPAVEYQVQLTAPVATAAPQQADPAQMGAQMKLTKKAKGGASDGPFPAEYGSISTSKMSFTVKEGDNTADFALK